MKDFKNYTSGEDLVADIINDCNGKSEGEILSEIFSVAERSRKAGTLTDEEIDEFYRQFSPSLNAIQKKKCKTLISKLKSIPMKSE